MLKLIGIALSMSLDIAEIGEFRLFLPSEKETKLEGIKVQPFIDVGLFPGVHSEIDNFGEYTRSYYNDRIVWYTPCAVKHERWSRFFNIFSVDMWIYFALSMALAVITTRCISKYSHKTNFHESNSYSNIFSLTVGVCKHTASLCTATPALLLLGVVQCCDRHSHPGVPHHIPYLTRVRVTNQNGGGNVTL